jgi:hypothetical protein
LTASEAGYWCSDASVSSSGLDLRSLPELATTLFGMDDMRLQVFPEGIFGMDVWCLPELTTTLFTIDLPELTTTLLGMDVQSQVSDLQVQVAGGTLVSRNGRGELRYEIGHGFP